MKVGRERKEEEMDTFHPIISLNHVLLFKLNPNSITFITMRCSNYEKWNGWMVWSVNIEHQLIHSSPHTHHKKPIYPQESISSHLLQVGEKEWMCDDDVCVQ